MSTRKSWHDKLTTFKDLPQVKPIPAAMQKRLGKGTIAIPSPLEVGALIRRNSQAPSGDDGSIGCGCRKKTPSNGGLQRHHRHFRVDCGICRRRSGARRPQENHAVLARAKVGGNDPKYPGGITNLKRRLEAEGHVIVARRARWFVQDFEQKLAKL